MNDSIREKLSAYLDGALPDAERRAVELEISRSEEMRMELEALRAVSAAVKGLPRETLPVGFRARLDARIAREGAAPAREYFILPPAYRPLAFALSTAVVALVVWDKSVTRLDIAAPHVGWDTAKVGVKSAAEAPPSIDVSGQLSAMNAAGKTREDETAENAAPQELTAQAAKKEDAAADDKAAPSSTFGKKISAPGKPLEVAEADGAASVAGALSGSGGSGLSAPPARSAPAAAPAAALDQLEPAEGNSFKARSEEERSAINEHLYQGFEEEKKRMGIAKIIDKDAEEEKAPSGGREFMTLGASPESPSLNRGRSVAAVRGVAKGNPSAPIVKAITLKSAEALATTWAAAGLSGEPPAVSFPDQMAIFLACPPGCGIVTVANRKKAIVVLYKDAGFDDASARVRAVTLSPKPVLLKLAQ